MANFTPNFSFAPTSRYYNSASLNYQDAEGRNINYLERRFLPQPERFAVLQQHTVSQDERIDQIAAKYLSDPSAFWRILDANRAMRAEDATGEIGQKLNITLPEGIPGLPNTGTF